MVWKLRWGRRCAERCKSYATVPSGLVVSTPKWPVGGDHHPSSTCEITNQLKSRESVAYYHSTARLARHHHQLPGVPQGDTGTTSLLRVFCFDDRLLIVGSLKPHVQLNQCHKLRWLNHAKTSNLSILPLFWTQVLLNFVCFEHAKQS